MSRRIPRFAGFTLIEVLVALVLMSLLAAISYRALDSVLETEARVRAEQAFWQKLAKSWGRLEADLENAVTLPVSADRPGVFIVGLTGSGSASFTLNRQLAEDAGGGVQQVLYAFSGGRLIRAVGRGELREDDASANALLEGLAHAQFRYMDAAGRWLADWSTAAELPRAVEVVVAWPDGRRMRRVFRTL